MSEGDSSPKRPGPLGHQRLLPHHPGAHRLSRGRCPPGWLRRRKPNARAGRQPLSCPQATLCGETRLNAVGGNVTLSAIEPRTLEPRRPWTNEQGHTDTRTHNRTCKTHAPKHKRTATNSQNEHAAACPLRTAQRGGLLTRMHRGGKACLQALRPSPVARGCNPRMRAWEARQCMTAGALNASVCHMRPTLKTRLLAVLWSRSPAMSTRRSRHQRKHVTHCRCGRAERSLSAEGLPFSFKPRLNPTHSACETKTGTIRLASPIDIHLSTSCMWRVVPPPPALHSARPPNLLGIAGAASMDSHFGLRRLRAPEPAQ